MKLLSKVTLSDYNYYLVLDDLISVQRWYLFSEIHPGNLSKVGPEMYEDSLTMSMLLSKGCSEYLVESVQRSKKTGVSSVYKSDIRLNNIIKVFLDSRDFGYSKDEIIIDESKFSDLQNAKSEIVNVNTQRFYASSSKYSLEYTKIDGIFNLLKFNNDVINVNLEPVKGFKSPRKLQYNKVSSTKRKLIDLVSIDKVTYEKLETITNLDWYRDPITKQVKKNYKSITTKKEFEMYCVTPMIRSMNNLIQHGEIPLIACDTETTGFNLLYLSEDNPERDEISTIQFSWEDNQGVIIYLDMEYFNNVDKPYVMNRFYDLFRYGYKKGPTTINLYYDEDGREIDESYTFTREQYWLTGHNTIFDSRVTLSEGTQYYFDHDTLQMAFNINPTTIKRDKGLKQLERYFFNETPPELSDLLGKGNEGKFRYLSDRRVTEIYGCADVDYSRKIFPELKKLMDLISPKMFTSYSKLDPISWLVAAESEYYGLRTNQEHVSKNSEIIRRDMNSIENLIYSYVSAVLQSRTNLILKGVDSSKLETKNSVDESELKISKDIQYKFKLAGDEVRNVMYKLLKYPVLVWTKGDKPMPAVNKKAIELLLKHKLDKPSNVLKEDLMSCANDVLQSKPSVLIEKDKFNSYKYPLCYLLQVYSSLRKEYDTYYKPFETEDLEGRLFKSIKTTNIETRRWSSAAQIIKKSLKKAIISHDDDYYVGDWDLNQVEARIFTSLAGDKDGIERLKDPERDYHTENASLMFQTPAHLVPKDLRSKSKKFGFGVPYGLSDWSLEEGIFGKHSEETALETRILGLKFRKANEKSMDFLEHVRDTALVPVNVPLEVKRFWKVPDDEIIGLVRNKNGFYRYFTLSNVLGDKKKEASIRRQAGNYPIQSYAADLYRRLVKRFYDSLIDYKIKDKVIFNMYIHDEVLFSVHKSIDPRLMCKVCAESCMLTLPHHTSYFIGLGFGRSWYEAKIDDNETPTKFLLEIKNNFDKYKNSLQSWTDDPMALMRPLDDNYKKRRVISCVNTYNNGLDQPIDFSEVMEKFMNYTVRSYVYEFKDSYKPKDKDEVDEFASKVCQIFMDEGLGLLKVKTGSSDLTIEEFINMRTSISDEVIELTQISDVDLLEDFYYDDDVKYNMDGDEELGYYSFDSEEFDDYVLSTYEDDIEVNAEDIELKPETYSYVKPCNGSVIVKCGKFSNLKKLEEYLKDFKDRHGDNVIVETFINTKKLPGKYNFVIKDLDDFVKGVREGVKVK